MSPLSKETVFTYADFDLQALCQRTSKLRPGVSCACSADQRPASGSFNWAIFVDFEDGVRWVFRAPHRRQFLPTDIAMKVLASEAAVLRYVRSHSDIPVPEVYAFCDSYDNEIGIPFILMSEAPGSPLSNTWKSTSSPQQDDLDVQVKAKIVSQIGAVIWRLSQLRFDTIGSIFEEDGVFQVKECLSPGYLFHERHLLEEVSRGPFDSEKDFHDSLISAFVAHAECLNLSHHCFVAPLPLPDAYETYSQYRSVMDLWNDFVAVGGKIDSSVNRLDYIIAGRALHDLMKSFRTKSPPDDLGSFPLYHADLSVNNIYVDDDYDITCITDWAFASTVPEYKLLATPGLPQPRNEISPELHIHFASGFIAAVPESCEETLLQRYRELLERGPISWKLTRLLDMVSVGHFNQLSSIWDMTYGSEKDMRQHFLQQRHSPEYIGILDELQLEDRPASKIKADEENYFHDKVMKHTIAKKLTLVSGWKRTHKTLRNDMFVADTKLWKWILQFIQDWEEMI